MLVAKSSGKKSLKTVQKKPVSKVTKSVSKKKEDSVLSDIAKQIARVDAEINKKCEELQELNQQILLLRKQKLELSIYPHKLGDTVLAEVQIGKTKKKSECVLEMSDGGVLYVRPIKNDGELSGRRFSICPAGEKTYHDFIEAKK